MSALKNEAKGLGQSCLTEVGRNLLERTKLFICLSKTKTRGPQSFYLRLGFNVAGQYDLLYF